LSSKKLSINSNFKGLNDFVKAFSDKNVVQVGIMGRKAMRTYSSKTSRSKTLHAGGNYLSNAELGAIHEFGSHSKNIPMRSFLRAPIHHEAERIVKDVKAADVDVEIVKSKNLRPVLLKIGIACVAAITRAFSTRGFGTWKADRPSTIRRKGSDSPLIDTGALRRSIDYRVTKATAS